MWHVSTFVEVKGTFIQERSTLGDGYEDLYAIFYGKEG